MLKFEHNISPEGIGLAALLFLLRFQELHANTAVDVRLGLQGAGCK
jgi:hypothetical protein